MMRILCFLYFLFVTCFKKVTAVYNAPLTSQGIFTTRKTRPLVLERASQIPWNATWASACNDAERALHLKWTSLSEEVVDVITQRDKLGPLNGRSMLLLGDSLMLQTAAAVEWVFPDFVEVANPFKLLLPKGSCLASHMVFFAGETSGFTIHACRNNQLGIHFEKIIAAVFKRSLVDVIVFNAGLWYNVEPYAGTEEELMQARKNASLGLGWTPLGKKEYVADLQMLSQQLTRHKSSQPIGVPYLLWVETTPSHFLGGTYGTQAKDQLKCVHFTASDYVTSHWRNKISEELVGGILQIPIVRHASHLASLHFSHVHTMRGDKASVDCTHWCNPGVVPLHTLTLIMNKVLLEQRAAAQERY